MQQSKKDKAREMGHLRWRFMSQKKKDRLLQDTLHLLCLLPETAALLRLAAEKGIAIRFNGDFIGTDNSGVTVSSRRTGETHIELKPYAAPEDIAPALIHELRHVWQNDRLGLTAKTMGLGETDAKTALLLMRVKEADAFAYTGLAIKRLNNAAAAFAESEELRKKLLKENGGKPLSEAQEDEISDVIAARIAARLPADRDETAAGFVKALTWLDSYDRETLGEYHGRYTHPFNSLLEHLTEKDGHAVTLAAIRSLTEAGMGPTRISYLDHLDDVEFENLVLRDVAPALLETERLMTAFEKSATPENRKAIDTQLRAALRQARPLL